MTTVRNPDSNDPWYRAERWERHLESAAAELRVAQAQFEWRTIQRDHLGIECKRAVQQRDVALRKVDELLVESRQLEQERDEYHRRLDEADQVIARLNAMTWVTA